MKQFVRFRTKDEVAYGQVTPEGVYRIDGTPFQSYEPKELVGDVGELDLLPPVEPTKIICIGLNYRDHAEETGAKIPDEPVMFLKPLTALIGPEDEIRLPPQSSRVDYEGELAIVVGREIFGPDEVDARRAIFGYTCANDVTARDIQRKDGQWVRGKGFNTFCPVGPYLNADVDLGDRRIETRLNGEVRQTSDFGQMLFDAEFLVHFVAQVMTLYPGDIIMTGTPSGIGPMSPGDVVEVDIEGFGILRNRAVSAD
ncbi:MAG: fumarylacetoacetate hydrolase family protein [Bacillota bacterium]